MPITIWGTGRLLWNIFSVFLCKMCGNKFLGNSSSQSDMLKPISWERKEAVVGMTLDYLLQLQKMKFNDIGSLYYVPT